MVYRKYISSRRWKKRRRGYYTKFGKACAACRVADQAITLHHMSYERLGAELDDDLLALCRPCHDRLHREYPETTLMFLADYQRRLEPFRSLSVAL